MPQGEFDFGNQTDKERDRKFCPNCGNEGTMIEQGEVGNGYIKYLCNNCYNIERKKKDDR